jgi:hypothetical protein
MDPRIGIHTKMAWIRNTDIKVHLIAIIQILKLFLVYLQLHGRDRHYVRECTFARTSSLPSGHHPATGIRYSVVCNVLLSDRVRNFPSLIHILC